MLEKLKSKETWKRLAIIFLLSLAITFITLVFACGEEGIHSAIFRSYLEDPLLITMNFIPIFMAFLSIYALSGRVWVGFLTTSLVFFILSVVEKYKLLFREEPFVIPEIALIRESAMMKGHYDISIFSSDHFAIAAIVAIVAITVILFKKYRMPLKGKGRWQFFAVVFALNIVFFRGFNGLYFTPKVYAQVGNEEIINTYNRTEEYMSKGFVYPFLFSGRMMIGDKPENYDKKLTELLWEKYQDPEIPEDKKVHVVSVMLESFSDFSVFEGVPIDPEVYRNLHEIQQESIHGNLVTDVFGGGTVNTERAFLTGYSGANHSGTATLLKDNHSYVRHFKDNGYVTEALHPIYGWFYNRKNVNPRLGFDEYLCYENYFKPIEEATGDDHWGYTRDEHFLPEVENRLNRVASEGNYYFSYALTYQGHGPYAEYNQADRNYIEPIEGGSAEDWAIINNYLSLVNDTDRVMGEFVESLRQNEAPVVLVFFGDHKPWLGENDSGYHTLGINIDQSTVEGNLNYYTTPYVIWANPAAKEKLGLDFEGQGPDLSPFLLMKYLFDYMDWPLDAMMQVQNDYLKDTTVFHTPLIRDEQGYRNVEEDPELLEMIRQYRSMEYYRKNEELN